MISTFLKVALRPAALLIAVFLSLSGCTTIKMYEGPERELPQLAVIYMFAGDDRLSVRYLNDKYVKARTNRAKIHVLPGNNKLTIAHANSEVVGRTITVITYLYTVSMDFQAGHSYIAWSGSSNKQALDLYQAPQEACIYEFTHADFEKFFDGNPHSVNSLEQGRKVGCGKKINANEYKKQHG